MLILLDRLFGGRRPVYIDATVGAITVAVLDGVKAAGLLLDELDEWFSWLPLLADGGGLLLPALVGGVIGFVIAKIRNEPTIDHTTAIVAEPAAVSEE